MALPTNSHVVSYNDYVFDSLHHSDIKVSAIYDEAQRTVTHSRVLLTVTGWLTADTQDNMEDAVTEMRQALMSSGGILLYQGKGFRLDVNSNGGIPDVAFGPIPRDFSVNMIGAGRAVLVTWVVETNVVLKCVGGTGPLLAWNTEISWSHDVNGVTVRTVQGYYTVPMTRTAPGNRQIPDSADRLWELVFDREPVGFRRENVQRQLSKDKRTIRFSWEDRELQHSEGVHLPAGIPQAQATHTIGASLFGDGFRNWRSSFSANIYVPPRQSKTEPLFRFFLSFMRGINMGPHLGGAKVYALRWEVGNEVYGLSTNFTLEYMLAGFSFYEALAASGMFRPIPGTSYAAWRDSMTIPHGPRGEAGLRYDPKSDLIIDTCTNLRVPHKLESPDFRPLRSGPGANNLRPIVDPEKSWYHYNAGLELLENNRVVAHTPLGERVDGTGAPDGMRSLTSNTQGSILKTDSGKHATILQKVGTPSFALIFQGLAVRLGWQPVFPELKNVPGVKELEREKGVRKMQKIGNVAGIPLWAASWAIKYLCDKCPTYLPGLSNPVWNDPGSPSPAPGNEPRSTATTNVLRPK